MRNHSVQCIGPHGLHRMAYVEWGDADNPRVLLCVHGLTRNGRDFDVLAQALAGDYRVVCPDVVGRGQSDWLGFSGDYGLPVYVSDIVTLIARLDAASVHWVGTSMGGLIGMTLAAQAGTPIQRLVLNDVGPRVSGEALRRIGEYVGKAPVFPDMVAAERYVRVVSAPFGRLSDDQWRHLTKHAIKRRFDGQYELAYDPAIGEPFRGDQPTGDMELWPIYDAIRCPTLVLRGENSDLLTAETQTLMTQRGPRARAVVIPNVGHAPALMDPGQVALVRSFLLET